MRSLDKYFDRYAKAYRDEMGERAVPKQLPYGFRRFAKVVTWQTLRSWVYGFWTKMFLSLVLVFAMWLSFGNDIEKALAIALSVVVLLALHLISKLSDIAFCVLSLVEEVEELKKQVRASGDDDTHGPGTACDP